MTIQFVSDMSWGCVCVRTLHSRNITSHMHYVNCDGAINVNWRKQGCSIGMERADRVGRVSAHPSYSSSNFVSSDSVCHEIIIFHAIFVRSWHCHTSLCTHLRYEQTENSMKYWNRPPPPPQQLVLLLRIFPSTIWRRIHSIIISNNINGFIVLNSKVKVFQQQHRNDRNIPFASYKIWLWPVRKVKTKKFKNFCV